MVGFVNNFYQYDSARHLVEDGDNESENEVDFNTIDVIAKKIQKNENESGNENDGKNIRLDSNSNIPIVVIND